MKRAHFSVIIIILISSLDIGCMHQQDRDGLNLSVSEVKIDAWLNLMPGGPGTFHIAGEIALRNVERFEIKNVHLSRITVTQLDKIIYSFAPEFTTKIENGDIAIPSETEKDFLFSTQSGLAINKELKIDLSIKITMLFKADDESFLYEIENIKVEKVY